MSVPRFSLVIPTLRRADTFRHALATLLDQTYEDFEIIVQNNGGDAETEAVVRNLRDPRIRHFSSDAILPMTENWELALDHARGDLITFIGDDDGLFPDACRIAAELMDSGGFEIVSWRPYCYYWPSYIHPELRNRLIATVDYDLHARLISSEHQLRRYYRFAVDYSHLPMIYNSFVRQSVVTRIRKRVGRYFLGFAPDVTSGIVNAAHTSQFAVVSRPLSMTGLSGHSTGHTMFLTARDQSNGQIDQRMAGYRFDDRLVPSTNLQIFLANEMLVVRDQVLADRGITVDFHRLIEFVAAAINDRPGFYDETLDSIRALAKRHDVALTDIAIPLPATQRTTLKTGSQLAGPRRVHSVIDGDRIGLRTIADAVRLMEQMVPRSDGTIDIRESRLDDRPMMRVEETVAFAVTGNGVAALGEGWADPEDWGTWTVSKRASMRLSVEPHRGRTLYADLRYRAFVHSLHGRLDIVCRARGRDIAAWRCGTDTASGVQRMSIPPDAIREDGTLDLEFHISDPRSPAELGVSSDTRQLGLGIEWLRLTTRIV
jgi:glycosyltransferase involved in cell wall biosynthesis